MSAGTPGAWVRTVALPAPSLGDNTADAERLTAALGRELGGAPVDVDLDLLRRLPAALREHGYRVRCTVFPDRGRYVLTGVDAADTPRAAAGLAVDLGTTRVALRLVDLATGTHLAEHGCDNPQVVIGSDVLARIHHAEAPGGLDELARLVVDGLNAAAARICEAAGIAPEDVVAVAVAGNTAMTHLFLGLDPRWMIREPYIPVANRPGVLRAADLGLRVGRWGPRARLPQRRQLLRRRPGGRHPFFRGCTAGRRRRCSSTSAPTPRWYWATATGWSAAPALPARRWRAGSRAWA